jgi:iron(III) transport system substrate-binding protein
MFKSIFRGIVVCIAALAVSALVAGPASAQKTKLTVYTALEPDQLGPYKEAFEKANPDVEIAWVRDSTGVITARVLAEKDNPRADVIWGLGRVFDRALRLHGDARGVRAQGHRRSETRVQEQQESAVVDGDGRVARGDVLQHRRRRQEEPAEADFVGRPRESRVQGFDRDAESRFLGTGYQAVYAWIQIMGEKAAWDFMDKLHQNIAVYTHSGSAPCVQAAKGERIIGIGFDMRGAKEKTGGAPIDIIMAKEGAPWDMEATAIVKGTKNLAAAQKLADFAVTKGAYELYGKYYAILGYPGINAAPPNYPPSADAAMAKIDLAQMGQERAKILAEWTKRYDSKSAPK